MTKFGAFGMPEELCEWSPRCYCLVHDTMKAVRFVHIVVTVVVDHFASGDLSHLLHCSASLAARLNASLCLVYLD